MGSAPGSACIAFLVELEGRPAQEAYGNILLCTAQSVTSRVPSRFPPDNADTSQSSAPENTPPLLEAHSLFINFLDRDLNPNSARTKMETKPVEIGSSKMFGGYNKRFKHFSPTLGCSMTFHIYFPPSPSSSHKFPVTLSPFFSFFFFLF